MLQAQRLGSRQAVTGGVERGQTHPKGQLPPAVRRWSSRGARDVGLQRAAESSQGRRRGAAKLCNPSRFISAWKATSAAPGELCWLRLPEGPGELRLKLAVAFLKLGCVLRMEGKFKEAEHYSVWVKHSLLRYTFKQRHVKSKQPVEGESKEERWSCGKENPAPLLLCISEELAFTHLNCPAAWSEAR